MRSDLNNKLHRAEPRWACKSNNAPSMLRIIVALQN